MKRYLQYGKTAGVYFSTSLLNQLIPFLMLPVLTAYLSVEDYGRITLFQTLIAFSVPLVGMSLSRQIDKYFFKREKMFIAKLIFQMMVIIIIMSVALFLVSAFSGLVTAFDLSSYWIYWVIALAMAISINTLIQVLLRNLKRPFLYAIFLIVQTGVNVGVSLWLIVGFGYDYEGKLVGMVLAPVLAAVIGLIVLYHHQWLIPEFDSQLLKKIWKISLPMIPFGIATTIITMSDVFFVKEMCSVEILGLYAIGLLFGKAIILVQSSITNVSEPWMLKQIAQMNDVANRRMLQFIFAYHGIMILLVLVGVPASMFAIDIMVDAKFHQGKEFVPIIMFGYALRSLQMIFVPFLIDQDKTGFMAINTLVMALLNIALNYVLINRMGATGAAYATLVTFLFGYVSMLLYASKIYPLPLKRIFRG